MHLVKGITAGVVYGEAFGLVRGGFGFGILRTLGGEMRLAFAFEVVITVGL